MNFSDLSSVHRCLAIASYMLSPLAFGIGAITLSVAFFSLKMLFFCGILLVISLTGFMYNYQLSQVYESGNLPHYQFNFFRVFDKDDIEIFIDDTRYFANDTISPEKHERIKELLYKNLRNQRKEQGYVLGYQIYNQYLDYLSEIDYAEYRLEVFDDEMRYVELIRKWGVPQPAHVEKKRDK